MQSLRYILPFMISLLAIACGGDNLQIDYPESTPAPDPGPPPPSPTENLATTPPAGMIGRIVYLGEVNNDFLAVHLFVTAPNGSNTTNLFPNADPFSYTGPSWSPTGDRLVVASNQMGNAEWDIYSVNADGSGLAALVAGPSSGDFAPSWSPDGSKVVFQSTTDAVNGFDVYLYDIATNVTTNLTSSPGDDELASWSPDGSRVLFQTTTVGQDASSSGTNLVVVNPDGSGRVVLTEGIGFQNSAGMFAPDGQTIAYESTAHQEVSATATIGDFEIYLMNADGTNPRRLTVGVGDSDASRFPTWSPDGRHIAFEFHDFTINQLFSVTNIAVMNADGSNIYLLDDQPVDGRYPRWGP